MTEMKDRFDSKNYQISHLKAISLVGMKKYSEAIECYDNAIEIEPDCYDCLYDKAIILREVMKHEEALECYGKAIQIKPDFVNALNNKASLLSTMRRNEEAKANIEEALDYLRNNATSTATATATALDTKGFICQNLGEYQDAIDNFDHAIKSDERHLSSWINKGMIKNRQRLYNDALECFEKAIDIENDSGAAWSGKADTYAHLYEYKEAEKCFEKAISIYCKNIKEETYDVHALNAKGIEALNGKGIALAGIAEHLHGKEKEEKFNDAIKCFDRIIKYYEDYEIYKDYDYIYACRNKGVVLVKLNKYEQAIYAFDKVLNIDSKFAYALNGKGIALANIGSHLDGKEKEEKFNDAIKYFEKALEPESGVKNPIQLITPLQNKGDVLDSLAQYHDSQMEYEEAIQCFDMCLKRQREFVCALVSKGRSLGCQRKYDEAKGCFNEAIQFYIAHHADKEPCFAHAYRYKAYTMLMTAEKIEQLSEALSYFEKATQIDPDSEHSWNSWGYALTSMGEFEKAVECFDKAVALDAEFAEALANRGYILVCLGKLDEAKKDFDRALEIDSNNAYVHNYNGLSYLYLKRYAKAVECFDRSLWLAKPEQKDYILANKGYTLSSRGWLLDALDCFEEISGIKHVRELDNKDDQKVTSYALNGKGIVLDELKIHDEAKECFNKAMILDPIRKDTSYLNIGRSYYQEEDYTNAIENFTKINDPKLEAQKRNGLGLCYFRLGLYEDAESEYRDAIKANPRMVEPYYNLGVLYNSEEKPERAKALFNTCLQLDNNFSKAMDALKKLEGTNQLSDWYDWWFKSGTGKKAIGITLISSIMILFFFTAFISITIPHIQLQNPIKLPSLILNTSAQKNETSIISATSAQKNESSATTSKPDITALIILIILLLIVLLLPSIKSVKLGTIELATSPIETSTVEIKPSIPMPFKSEYMSLYFHMPIKSGIGMLYTGR
jgi:tetratricopeptide (TPR) repeat protein